MQVLQLTEFGDLSFGLSHSGMIGQGLGNGLAVHLVGQTGIGAMAWIFGLIAMAVWFTTSARGGSDRTTPQVAESRDLIGGCGLAAVRGIPGTLDSS